MILKKDGFEFLGHIFGIYGYNGNMRMITRHSR